MSTSTPPSPARLAANRRNAAKSTGPTTPQGKASSRRNALKHGLTATVVDLDDQKAPVAAEPPAVPSVVAEPRPPWHDWLAGRVTRTMNQITRAERVEARLRDQAAWRARTVWDDDQALAAEEVGAGLSRDPARTVARLRQTPHGVDWLLKRWGWLVRAAEPGGTGWTEAQTSLAFDLLGIAEEGRTGSVCDPIHCLDLRRTPTDPLDLARGMVTDLLDNRAELDEADRIARSLAEADLIDTPTPQLARLRRYDAALHKRLGWLLAELRSDTPPPDPGSPAAAPPIPPTPPPPPPPPPTDPPAASMTPVRNEPKPAPVLAAPQPIAAEIPGESPPSVPLSARPPRPDLARFARREHHHRRSPQPPAQRA